MKHTEKAEKPRASCGHFEWANGHCAEMSCPNYVNKCDTHGIGRGE